MPVRRFSHDFLDAIAAHIDGGMASSRKRNLGWHVDVAARLRGSELGGSQRFGVHKKRRPSSSMTFGDLAASARREKISRKGPAFLKLAMS